MNYNKTVLDIFADKEIIKKADADKYLKFCESKGVSAGRVLMDEKAITEEQYATVIGEVMGMPFISLDNQFINKMAQGNTVTNGFIKKHRIIPVDVDENGILTVAVADPLNLSGINALNALIQKPKKYVVANPSKIDNYIASLFAAGATTSAIGDLQEQFGNTKEFDTVVQNDPVNAPAVRLADSIIREAIPLRASDIHIEPYENRVRVRYRIDGELSERFEFPINSYPAVLARYKIMSGINIAERRIPQDGRIAKVIDNIEYDFRVSTLPVSDGEKIVIRILDKNSFAFTRENLGFTPKENTLVNRFLEQPHGIILLTGPTGCGKTTTLYSFLQEINKPTVNIVTVEDPIEYTIEGINQVQVNNRAGLTFATSLRAILRQDPNIIMIGEMRDEETADIAIRAAITGHLVFSTLHTNDAPGSVARLLDMKIEPYLLADALVGVISQRLVKKLCPYCKEKVITGPTLTSSLGLDRPTEIYEPRGCRYCNYTGYKGRTAVHEVLSVDDNLKYAISERYPLDDIRRISMENGMVPLWDSGRNLVIEGVTSVSELLTITEKT